MLPCKSKNTTHKQYLKQVPKHIISTHTHIISSTENYALRVVFSVKDNRIWLASLLLNIFLVTPDDLHLLPLKTFWKC